MWKACSLLGSQPPGSPPPCSACAAPAPPLPPPPASQQLTEPEPGPRQRQPPRSASLTEQKPAVPARPAAGRRLRDRPRRRLGGGASETGGVGDGGCLGRGPSQAQSQADPPCARHWSLACTAGSVQLRVTSCSKAGRLPGPGMQGSRTDVLGRGAGHWPRLCVRSCFPGGRGPAGPGSGGAAHVHGVLPPAPVTRSTSPFS